MHLPDLAWPILLLPLAAAVGIVLFTLRRPEISARLSVGAVLLAFALSLIVAHRFAALELPAGQGVSSSVRWLEVEGLRVEFGLRLDWLSVLMLLVVTGVGGAIHIYSCGYMRHDPGYSRYFAGLSLFTFSMLGIVLATGFFQLFIFWELVGVSSYLLIGFWYDRPAAADACKKAFLTNRVGDFGFLLGILVVWATLGTLDFAQLEAILRANPAALGALATTAGLLIFAGAVGKSAQFPLHVWLPDAMEGPTPVSALIHAATMVAAGVYMLCRVFFLLAVPGSHALDVIAWTGALTALLAALMAVQQSDIKRILAYSTLSQLGYMVMAVGLAGGTAAKDPSPAMFHLATHACFKALLFLGAGSVIHALHHEQDIWKMGALARRLPVTFGTFLLGTLALCGVPPLSGFYSKDAILALAWDGQRLGLFACAVVVAGLTPFYMFRLVFVAFTGPAKSQLMETAHEPPRIMTWPLVALAVPSALAAFWGIDTWLARQYGALPGGETASWLAQVFAPFHHAPVAAGTGLAVTLAGLGAAWKLYGRQVQDPLPPRLGGWGRALRRRFYFDEAYARLIAVTQDALAEVADAVDRWIIAGLGIKGLHGTVEVVGRLLRLVQTGNLQTYAFLGATGLVVMLVLALLR